MSLEAFHQLPTLEAPLDGDGELFTPSATSPHMEQVVTQLATIYGVDLAQQNAFLNIDQPEYFRRWLIANIDGERIGITRCQIDQNELLMPELDMVFAVTPHGWAPRELVHSDQVWQGYTHAMQAAGQPVADEQDDFSFAAFTDFIAQDLERHIVILTGNGIVQKRTI